MSKAESEKKQPVKRRSKPFPVVAIGASAGGLEAITDLLKNLSPETGMAYVYIQHLDPNHDSKLSEILSRATAMGVQEARHLLPVERNHVYVIPPNKDLSIVDGILRLNPRTPKPSIHMPIDKFFHSLAEKQQEGSIGVVLSGNAHDGTFGLRSIKLAGGLTFAQDDSAKFQSMPKSAIAEGVVDMVLSPKEIAKELERISRHPAVMPAEIIEDDKVDIADGDKDLLNIIQLMRKATGVDFSHYKMNTIKRRIIRRMLLYKLETLEEYFLYLKQHAPEINVLYQDMLINVTSFFRDPDMIEYLKKSVLPRIIKTKSQGDPLRIWIPACATGEEAYSLAIVLMEVLENKPPKFHVQIFATDLSDMAISRSRLGLYSVNELENVSKERMERFFEKIDGSYRVVKSIRDLCVFATHNVFKDPPFSRLDLISCCNLMIYLDNMLQKKIISIFHYCLRDTGLLVLGKSETIGAAPELFTQVEKKYKLFSKKKEKSTSIVFDMHYRVPGTELPTPATKNYKADLKMPGDSPNLENIVDDILLRQFVPASVVVNGHLDILQFRGSTSLFLEPSHGKASLNLLKMARPGLVFELRNTIHKVNKSGERLKKTGLEIRVNGNIHHASIEVMQLPSPDEERLFLVIFQEMAVPPEPPSASSLTKDKMVTRLQDDLATAKEDMRSMIEEQEASVEELQSANEEIVSSNEELQSINEEMETSKEELESSNEELMTINHELQVRNDQLAESYEYAEVVFQTIQEAVIVLDREFRVKKANQIFYDLFKVSPQETENLLLFELGHRQWNILKLRELLEKVAGSNEDFSGFELRLDFPKIGEKVMVLKARRILQKIHRQQLIVISIMDITEHKMAEKIISDREAWFRNTANNVPVMIWVSEKDRQFSFFNNTWLNYTGRTAEQEAGFGWTEGIHKSDLRTFLDTYNLHFTEKKAFQVEFRLRNAEGNYLWVLNTGEPTFLPDGSFSGFVGSCAAIHDKKILLEEMEKMVVRRTRELQEAIKDLEYSNSELNQYAYVASHDLQEPLRKIITFSDRLSEHNQNLSKEDGEYLEKIIHSAERMRKLINDLLNFSRMSRLSNEFVSTDLNLLLDDASKDLDLVMEEKDAVISQEKLPVVKCIPLQMQQLFYNLLSNALKFSPENTRPGIDIRSREMDAEELKKYPSLDQEKTYCEMVFADNGIGFKQEFADQIFTIFQRLNEGSKYSGAGIGLALCRKIVVNHKGLIFARSQPGKGSAFHVILPYEP
jgi:two-component system CheB/CheR fusion protein